MLSMSTQIYPMCKVQGGSGVTETHLQIKVPDTGSLPIKPNLAFRVQGHKTNKLRTICGEHFIVNSEEKKQVLYQLGPTERVVPKCSTTLTSKPKRQKKQKLNFRSIILV